MSLLDNLPHKCKIQRRKRAAGSLGTGSSLVVEQTDVACWVQQAGTSEIKEYERRGMRVNRKIYFNTNPGITEQHELVITELNDVAIPAASQVPLEVRTEPRPDASAGLGVLYKVMAEEVTSKLT